MKTTKKIKTFPDGFASFTPILFISAAFISEIPVPNVSPPIEHLKNY
jgi:hypothetical protein